MQNDGARLIIEHSTNFALSGNIDGPCNNNFTVIGKKNNQTSVSDTDREIPTLGSTDNAETR